MRMELLVSEYNGPERSKSETCVATQYSADLSLHIVVVHRMMHALLPCSFFIMSSCCHHWSLRYGLHYIYIYISDPWVKKKTSHHASCVYKQIESPVSGVWIIGPIYRPPNTHTYQKFRMEYTHSVKTPQREMNKGDTPASASNLEAWDVLLGQSQCRFHRRFICSESGDTSANRVTWQGIDEEREHPRFIRTKRVPHHYLG